MWPFGKKNSESVSEENEADFNEAMAPEAAAETERDLPQAPGTTPDMYAVTHSEGAEDEPLPRVTKSGGGPFDIQDATPDQFDFSDFAKASVNLGSVLLPIPHEGDIQVEMGPQGPTMLHVATPYGRITPVAFAAPSSGGQWEPSAAEIEQGLSSDGLDVTVENGPWGSEVVGKSGDMEMRIIGADGHRWMLRVTATGEARQAEQLAHIARGILARSFVSRGDNPMPAGQPLPVTLPAQMAEEIRKAYQQQIQQQEAAAESDEA